MIRNELFPKKIAGKSKMSNSSILYYKVQFFFYKFFF